MSLSFIQDEPHSWPMSSGIGSNSPPPHHDPDKDKQFQITGEWLLPSKEIE